MGIYLQLMEIYLSTCLSACLPACPPISLSVYETISIQTTTVSKYAFICISASVCTLVFANVWRTEVSARSRPHLFYTVCLRGSLSLNLQITVSAEQVALSPPISPSTVLGL